MTAVRTDPSPAPAADDFVSRLCDRLGGEKAIRLKLPAGGRIHIDRALPFLVIHRNVAPSEPSAARGVAVASPVYAVWPGRADADALGRDLVAELGRALQESLGAFLLIELYDLPTPARQADSPEPAAYCFRIDASEDDLARAAARVLRETLCGLSLDRRAPDVEAGEAPGLTRPAGVARVAIGLPRVWAVPDGGLYPGLLHELEAGVLDAVLQAAATVVAASSQPTPPHYRALGRRSFIRAARQVDRKLAGAATAFDFLLGISPINTAQAWAAFRDGKHQQMPVFHYRPLTIDPIQQKRDLFSIDVTAVEDPVLERLFREKQQEIDLQLTILQDRGDRRAALASAMLYGEPDDRLVQQAEDLISGLARIGPAPPDDDPAAGAVDCHGVEESAWAVIERYRERHPGFKAEVSIRDDISGLMVSKNTFMIPRRTRLRRDRLDPLLQHEISIHLLTWITGSAQGLQIFRTGLAGYEGLQEGLGVFAEYAVGGLTRARLQLLAGRVLAARALMDSADFMEAFRLLHDDRGLPARTAFNIVARTHRSGGLVKDFIYLRGLLQVLDHLAAGHSLAPFWSGKVALGHVPVIEELNDRGFLAAPPVTPEFLDRPETAPLLARARAGLTLPDLIQDARA